jgi:hypothetical protein
MTTPRIKEGPSCPGCGLPNYEGLCPVCRGDEQAYMDELHFAFGDFYPGQSASFSSGVRDDPEQPMS